MRGLQHLTTLNKENMRGLQEEHLLPAQPGPELGVGKMAGPDCDLLSPGWLHAAPGAAGSPSLARSASSSARPVRPETRGFTV